MHSVQTPFGAILILTQLSTKGKPPAHGRGLASYYYGSISLFLTKMSLTVIPLSVSGL